MRELLIAAIENLSDEQILSAIAKLPDVRNVTYSDQQRYADFRKVFKSQHGQRVFAQILAWGKIHKIQSFGNPVDPYKAMIYIGESNIAKLALAAYLIEPQERPQTQEKG